MPPRKLSHATYFPALDSSSGFLASSASFPIQRNWISRQKIEEDKKHRLAEVVDVVGNAGRVSRFLFISRDGDVPEVIVSHLNWNPRLIAVISCVCKWFDDIAKRVLWKEFCRSRAPKMMLDLQSSGSQTGYGNWKALAKLLTYCSGCSKKGLFNGMHIPSHFVHQTRFSRTSGQSFLIPQCRTDVLYVSDPCEHIDQAEDCDVGFFRGVFKSFFVSKVRKMLVDRGAKFHPTEACPYCKAKMWSMLQAKMIPKSAGSRLGSYDDCIDYYVCLNGHLLGRCTLLPLSSDSEGTC